MDSVTVFNAACCLKLTHSEGFAECLSWVRQAVFGAVFNVSILFTSLEVPNYGIVVFWLLPVEVDRVIVFWVIFGAIVGSLGISQVREGLPVV
jgi:hypothetical protein